MIGPFGGFDAGIQVVWDLMVSVRRSDELSQPLCKRIGNKNSHHSVSPNSVEIIEPTG